MALLKSDLKNVQDSQREEVLEFVESGASCVPMPRKQESSAPNLTTLAHDLAPAFRRYWCLSKKGKNMRKDTKARPDLVAERAGDLANRRTTDDQLKQARAGNGSMINPDGGPKG
jgi:hypothetical protein